ncbi:MAG: hypothetical protein ACREQ5_14475, partial [Candidatus Dormibacteria bacterium]
MERPAPAGDEAWGRSLGAYCNVNELLDGHVALDVRCLDRIYLNAYVPNLQVGGQVVTFLTRQLGYPIPSPALFATLGERFRDNIKGFAREREIPIVQFKKGQRKADVMQPYLDAGQTPGVVAIGTAQEFQSVINGYRRESAHGGTVSFGFQKADRRVSVYYFYIRDQEFGPGFIKLCSYFPYPGKVWLNGHEWAKRQAIAEGLRFSELANGFASCEDPARLQAICDRLGPDQIQGFFDRWMEHIPTPLGAAEREHGYWWDLSMRQIETSRTLVFDAPRHARGFFESVIADNLDLGRPDEIELIFGRRVQKNTTGEFATRITQGTEVRINVLYRNSRIKQYLKERRALRVELVCNSPGDLGCQRRLKNLPELQQKARAANDRLLTIQRAGQGCAISTTLLERVQQPSFEEGQRTGALRFGDERAMALAGALCAFAYVVVGGFNNRSLRAHVAALLCAPYSSAQMS